LCLYTALQICFIEKISDFLFSCNFLLKSSDTHVSGFASRLELAKNCTAPARRRNDHQSSITLTDSFRGSLHNRGRSQARPSLPHATPAASLSRIRRLAPVPKARQRQSRCRRRQRSFRSERHGWTPFRRIRHSRPCARWRRDPGGDRPDAAPRLAGAAAPRDRRPQSLRGALPGPALSRTLPSLPRLLYRSIAASCPLLSIRIVLCTSQPTPPFSVVADFLIRAGCSAAGGALFRLR
jgi:hypothetical protein